MTGRDARDGAPAGGRAARAAAQQGRPVGRHERRPRPVQPPERHLHSVPSATPAGGSGATGATQGGRAARAAGGGTPRMTRATTTTRVGRMTRVGGGSRVVRVTRLSLAGRYLRRARSRWTARVADAQQARATAAPVAEPPGVKGAAPVAETRPERRNAPVSRAGRRRGPATMEPRHLAGSRQVAGGRVRRVDRHEDAVAGWCAVLLVLGLYLGGWGRQGTLDPAAGSVLSPWSGLLFLGFAGTAVWVLARHQGAGGWSPRAVPSGDRLGLLGMALALVALLGEVVWGLLGDGGASARALGPFRLLLFCGAGLLAGSALRAAWTGSSSARVAGLQAFWPVVLSSTLVVAVAAYAFQDVAPVVAWHRPPAAGPLGTEQAEALVGLLAHNLLFLAPVLLLLRRWRTPLGTFTVLAGSVALLLATQTGFALVGLAGAAVLGGAAADLGVHLLRPSPQRAWAVRWIAVAAAAVYWTAHYAFLAIGYGVGTAPEVWLGSVAWAVLSGFGLALLAWPPAVPLTAWNRGRARSRAPATATATPLAARMVGR